MRSQFPLLQTYTELIYLDNAATTQKPQAVLTALNDFYTKANANVHRGLYPLAELATAQYEDARNVVGKFIGAKAEEIIFTSGTTDSLNLVANMLARADFLPTNPKVLIGAAEHHANLVPWQMHNYQLSYVELDADFQYDFSQITEQPDIVAVSLVSNVTGALLDVAAVRARFPHSILVIDAAQAIGHMPIDVKQLDCDLLAFSGHKLYAPTGVGVLYGKQNLLEKLNPARVGGGMINKVERSSSTWAALPEKFEAGTPPIAEAVALATAIKWLKAIGWSQIVEHEEKLSLALAEQLKEIPGIKLYHPQNISHHAGVFSFSIEGLHAHDIAYILGQQNVAARAGHHCTQILHRETLQTPSTTRLSVGIYNTADEIEKVGPALRNAIAQLQ